ncbi:carbonic anhydrase [Plantactinospora endophytica]|uniref:carbonic anhydrase n=1 Tax=Plantactinospora endophytica TaxID=673535 RepID=A0ABQ4DVD7_9ACTN|nr:carbonic anhydrase [Plantactinospora endophytica]GIG86428.1 carbonic anhydrase [Plantactinospora endophytica]
MKNFPRQSTLSRRSLLAAGGLTAVGTVALAGPATAQSAGDPPVDNPQAALARLLDGNRRFVQGQGRHPHQSPRRIHDLAAGQDPFAIVVGCADSRVPPEVLFDQGLGDLFDNRVAGNIVDTIMLGSIEYAVEHFASPLLVVLGHERCGAVSAAVDTIASGGTAPGSIQAIVEALRPVVEPLLGGTGDIVEAAVRANVLAQAQHLVEASEIIAEQVHAGHLEIVGARYDLDNGRVTLVS